MHSKRAHFGMAVIDDMIFAIGGYTANTYLTNVEYFDSRKNKWFVFCLLFLDIITN
jgi:hypothetical protein